MRRALSLPVAAVKGTIWKYPLPIERRFTLELPIGAQILSVQMQGEVPTLWVGVNPENKSVPWEFAWMATGETLDENPRSRYLGTIQVPCLGQGDILVFHLFGTGAVYRAQAGEEGAWVTAGEGGSR